MAIANAEVYGMNKEVQNWIDAGCPWVIGIDIFKNRVNNKVLLALFESGETNFTKKRLREELEKMLPANKIEKSAAAVSQLPKYDASNLPEPLKSEFIRKGDLYKMASQLHGDLYHEKSKEKRAELYQQIKTLFEEIDSIWKKCDQFMGLRPTEVIVPDENDRAKLLQQRNNLRSNLSKARSRNKPDKIAEFETQLAIVEEKLNHE